ncbi:hypothetical protein NA57DRAFT_75615 [Rhizodiscina lignyota]|uniref:Glycoside hydrolase family 43 protein n=1 Tax=Rhizodiscina lignyota TaxID=1504668 RepID=A0A9P4IHI6_9PEZI|nr:hypothetical protein NA57DRAFT_75615 [Rhizodiscina lignyota]
MRLYLVSLLLVRSLVFCQSNDTLGLSNGYSTYTTTNWNIKLVKDSQTLASLKPSGSNTFDFSPFDVLGNQGSNSWTDGNTASNRAPVRRGSNGSALATSDLGPTLPGLADLDIIRQWIDIDGDLGLLYTITNTANGTVELGSLGFPIEFNNIFTGRPAADVEANCSLQDPYIGLDAGYIQVTPVDGTGSALVVTPLKESKFEAWRFLNETYKGPPLYYQSQTYEANYEFQVYTKAYAENEWKNVTPWNEPTSRMLRSKETLTVGLRFSLAAGGVTDIAATAIRAGIPQAQSVPGYIVPSDAETTLTLNTTSRVLNITITPANALAITPISNGVYTITPASNAYGRTRLTIAYSDGHQQTIHYNIVKSAPTVLSDLGHFLTTTQYYTNTSDPFHRAPSVLSWDRSVNNFVLQDNRVWIAGLSDEAGAGSFLAATMKQSVQANADEIARLETFIHHTMWGVVQVSNGTDQYAVRKSVFYYGMPGYPYDPNIEWTGAWNKTEAYSTSRAYDYVHVSAAYWALYRAARAFPDLVKLADWQWYLNQAYQTVMYATQMTGNDTWFVGYADDGLMGETVWGEILKDLGREGMDDKVTQFEARMKARAKHWNSLAVPFGSEMAWDSTGQEGVYYWCNYFNLTATVTKTINSILGYMPTVAHWGWNGNARRYWDFLYGGKIERIERQIHHYGSGLNALPLLEHVRNNSSSILSDMDAYMLRVGYGGNSGPLSNVDSDGFASAAFHSWPDTLKWDPYSGDYGPNFVGLSLGAGCFIVQEQSGNVQTMVYGGNVKTRSNATLLVEPRDAVRRRVYIGAWRVQVELDAGAIQQIQVDTSSQTATITIVDAVTAQAAKAKQAVVWVDNYQAGGFKVTTSGLQASRKGILVLLVNGTANFQVGK